MKTDKEIVLFGYSGHAFVVAEALQKMGYQLAGYLEKQEQKFNPYGINYFGFEQNSTLMNTLKNYAFFPSIGNNMIRRKIFMAFSVQGFEFITAIHPNSNLSSLIKIGSGTLICQGANINPLVEIGCGAIINTGAIVEHECKIGNFSHIAPGAVLAGNVVVGENTFIGANSVVKHGVKIGNNIVVGAGAVVLHDLLDNQTYIGNPAKLISI